MNKVINKIFSINAMHAFSSYQFLNIIYIRFILTIFEQCHHLKYKGPNCIHSIFVYVLWGLSGWLRGGGMGLGWGWEGSQRHTKICIIKYF